MWRCRRRPKSGRGARCGAAALPPRTKVRCFSDSTRRLLRRAYPDLAADRISVIPHQVDFVPSRLPALDHSAPLVVGIIGQISEQKGGLVVKEMLDRIDREHLDVRVVVIGALDVPVKSERLRVTGPYRHDELVDLIEDQRDQPVPLPVGVPGDVFLCHRGDDPARATDRRVRPRGAGGTFARLRQSAAVRGNQCAVGARDPGRFPCAARGAGSRRWHDDERGTARSSRARR